MKKITCILLSLTFVITVFSLEPNVNATKASSIGAVKPQSENLPTTPSDYNEYLAEHSTGGNATNEIILNLNDFTSSGDVKLSPYEGETNVIITQEGSFVEWNFNVAKSGFYNLHTEYFPIAGRGAEISREVFINGEVPFSGAEEMLFSRRYKDEKTEWDTDNNGNQLKPSIVEAPDWLNSYAVDDMGYETEPYKFYLIAGENKLRFNATNEPLALKKVAFTPPSSYIKYSEAMESIDENNFLTGKTIKIDAEKAKFKSDPMLYPVSVKSSYTSDPFDYNEIRLNAIGGRNWSLPNQYITWEFEVEESGYYNIALKARQKEVHGLFTSRRIYIDDKIPYEELSNVQFNYSSEWENVTLGNDEPFLFYFDKGIHEIKAEVTLGSLGDMLNELNESVYNLNNAYRRIFILTGSTPDTNRDYNLDKLLPDVIELLASESERLSDIAKKLFDNTGTKGAEVAIIDRLAQQSAQLAKDADIIPKMLADFKSNVGSLGSLLFTMSEQPLEIDYIMVYTPDQKLPRAKANFFENILHEIKGFSASFTTNYSSVGNSYENGEEALTVWVLTGRDQSQVLKQMIDNDFSPNTGINVNLQLVQASALLSAVVAGKSPDVAIQMAQAEPINYAMRGAVKDLSKMDGFAEVEQRFYDSAIEPFRFEGGVYAIPETQNFPVMFYRKDILGEMNIELPNTWSEVYNVIGELQKNNMEFGIPVTSVVSGDNINSMNGGITSNELTAYSMFLFQNNESLYRNGGMEVNFDAEVCVDQFRTLCKLYSEYKLPQEYNFPNRFRTGEMPIGIADYGMYNYLSVFAPEIKGNWGFTTIPGTAQENGEINRAVALIIFGLLIIAAAVAMKSVFYQE